MKKLVAILLSALLLTSCGTQAVSEEQTDAVTKATTEPTNEATESTTSTVESEPEAEVPEASEVRILVAYFSCTGTTEQIAGWIASEIGADLYEIVAADPYTEEDLQYYTGGRADQEQSDDSARPEIDGAVEDISQYDIIFLGYPIWHGQAPKIIYTFLESYDLENVTIIPFCTSHSSGIGSSAENLHSLASDTVTWDDGRRFSGDATESDVIEWLETLNLPESEVEEMSEVGVFNFETKTVLLNSGYEMPILGLGTYSLSDDECAVSIAALLEAGGRLIDTAYMYGNEAAVGEAIRNSDVPREEIFVITKSTHTIRKTTSSHISRASELSSRAGILSAEEVTPPSFLTTRPL